MMHSAKETSHPVRTYMYIMCLPHNKNLGWLKIVQLVHDAHTHSYATILQTKAILDALKPTIQMEIALETVAQMELISSHVTAGS